MRLVPVVFLVAVLGGGSIPATGADLGAAGDFEARFYLTDEPFTSLPTARQRMCDVMHRLSAFPSPTAQAPAPPYPW
jgi:hypothetical protein